MLAWSCLLVAWLVALAATGGALFIGEVMGMKPCLLCWYQRIAMFPLVPVLGIACFAEDRRGAVYALPLAAVGAVIALYHVLLVHGIVSEGLVPCDATLSCADQKLEILGGVQIPWLSLMAFALIVILLTAYLRKTAPR